MDNSKALTCDELKQIYGENMKFYVLDRNALIIVLEPEELLKHTMPKQEGDSNGTENTLENVRVYRNTEHDIVDDFYYSVFDKDSQSQRHSDNNLQSYTELKTAYESDGTDADGEEGDVSYVAMDVVPMRKYYDGSDDNSGDDEVFYAGTGAEGDPITID